MRWETLTDEEYIKLWEEIYDRLEFHPNVNPKYVTLEIDKPAFKLSTPYVV